MNPLRRFRNARKLSQSTFAQLCGIHQPTLSLLERSVRTRENPDQEGATAAHAARIAQAFGRDITEDQILYPGNYMTAEDFETTVPEPAVA